MRKFEEERGEMLELLKQRGIISENLLKAMAKVERHHFVQEPFVNRAYDDCALPIGFSQTISQPYTVAFMTQCLDVKEGEKILEIGTGSGYQACILAEMGSRVFTIERHPDLLAKAIKLFENLGYNIASKVGDGTVGWSEYAPFDGIIVTAGAPEIPDPLLKQLSQGGRLVIPIGDFEMQKMNIVVRHQDRYERKEVYGFKFVPLIGKEGWN